MTVVTGLRSMMLTNVTRTVSNRRIVTLPRSVEREEDYINVASGENISYKMDFFINQLSVRRDKIFCHECRFCCTLSICTNNLGLSYFMDSSDKPLNGSQNKVIIIYM